MEKGERQFERIDIVGESSAQNPFGVAVSQLHGVELKDIDGDGAKDIVTGVRWHAHYGKDPDAIRSRLFIGFGSRSPK